jgi:hypothetical protein
LQKARQEMSRGPDIRRIVDPNLNPRGWILIFFGKDDDSSGEYGPLEISKYSQNF